MREGVRYYENENDIMTRQQYAVIDGVKMIDEDKPNNKIPHGWHKLLVDQKVAYLVGNPINFDTKDEELLEHINEYFGDKYSLICSNNSSSFVSTSTLEISLMMWQTNLLKMHPTKEKS